MAKIDYTKLAKKKKLTEKEVNALKNYMNKVDFNEANKLNNLVRDKEGTKLDASQVAKGKKFLYNYGFTPKGERRSRSNFGYREDYIVKNLKTIELLQFHNAGTFAFPDYMPYYQAIGKDGSGMDYFYYRGKLNIWG